MNLIGNNGIWQQLSIAMHSAVKQNRALPHILLAGAAGCGKTSTAKQIAKILKTDFKAIACDSLKQRRDVLKLAAQLNRQGYDRDGNKVSYIRPTVIFIDEIHGLSVQAQEMLGILMEEFYLPLTQDDLRIIKFANKKVKQEMIFKCPEFTLIGATTNDGKLTKPFRDRFKLRFLFQTYNIEEAKEIVKVHAKRLEIPIEEKAVEAIAKRGRGVPRILVSLLERCRDFVIASHQAKITYESASVVFELAGIDDNGLTKTDIDLMKILYEINAPIGLENLATILHESPKVLSETVEPYLIQQGLIIRGKRGREITEKGIEYLAQKGIIKLNHSNFYIEL